MNRWLKILTAFSVGAVLLFAASPAQSAFTLTLKETGQVDKTVVLAAGNAANITTVVFGDYSVNMVSRSSSPGVDPSTGQANLQHVDLNIQLNPAGAKGDLEIILTDNGYTNSLGNPVYFEGSLASSFISPGGKVTTTHSLNGVALIGPQVLTGVGSIDNTVVASPGGGATFAMSNDSFLHLTGIASSAQFTVTTQVSPVPAPAGLVLALTGMPVLAFGGWVRRRWLKKS
jgi:hypothetical protein